MVFYMVFLSFNYVVLLFGGFSVLASTLLD